MLIRLRIANLQIQLTLPTFIIFFKIEINKKIIMLIMLLYLYYFPRKLKFLYLQ